jgi:hypothetical protein
MYVVDEGRVRIASKEDECYQSRKRRYKEDEDECEFSLLINPTSD